MREILLSELVKDLLGPRNGAYETMKHNPRDEYITGVLAPVHTTAERDPETENLLLQFAGDDTAGDDEFEDDIFFSPELNPQLSPHSMGLSFVLETKKEYPSIRLCITWARYRKKAGRDGEIWERKPRVYVTDEINLAGERYRIFLEGEGKARKCSRDKAEVSVLIRCKKLEPLETGYSRFFVAVYLTCEIRTGRITEEEHIFQPQIRVVAGDGCRLSGQSPLCRFADEEQRELEFLYREKPVPARGYLCSAVWKDIDPLKEVRETGVTGDLPFAWPDGEPVKRHYGLQIYDLFFVPDVRSEFIPLFAIQNPDFSWQGDEIPELDPGRLAEMWDAGEMEKALRPFCTEYRKWVKKQEEEAEKLEPEKKKTALRLVARCRKVLERIEKGIELLKNDREVRLCFCFANRAIQLQAQWKNQDFKWRPFQLAFILMVIESIANPGSEDRDVCDLLWIPTGGGKTETYLAVIAFTLALRRRLALTGKRKNRSGAGVGVIMRYTLRLLTIQQFRRALKLIAACEYLRVFGLGSSDRTGWRPRNCEITDNFIWGTARFSAGLWVGGNVTPNRLKPVWTGRNEIPGAIDILEGKKGNGEPAQVLECPACGTILAFPENGGLRKKSFILNLVVHSNIKPEAGKLKTGKPANSEDLKVAGVTVTEHAQKNYYTLSLHMTAGRPVNAGLVEDWWKKFSKNNPGMKLVAARASRPGYFIRKYGKDIKYDFDIFCPNPECPLHSVWTETQPAGQICDKKPDDCSPTAFRINVSGGEKWIESPDGNKFIHIPEPFRIHNSPYLADRIPVPAYVVDSQIYTRCPSLVVATVDKFARLPFEPRCASLFGNVEYHHCLHGYYRISCPPPDSSNGKKDGEEHPGPKGTTRNPLYVKVENKLDPPELIIQDELHLIEGPIGSLTGLYETVIDRLCSEENTKIKYIASTATVTRAAEQIESLFSRRLQQFPPPGLHIEDRFFAVETVPEFLDDRLPGRLYAGICAPGKGPLTPVIRIWARLLQSSYKLAKRLGVQADPYWTVTGYFNARKELAGARAVYWQDIVERINQLARDGNGDGRQTGDSSDRLVELSGRTASEELPVLLDVVNTSFSGDTDNPGSPDALLATSMFGTGIDIPRLGLMVVHGQPKTTSAYIQSTGRVGRRNGALVVVFYRATRPRDMSHYEMFCGYHLTLAKHVEPVTVAPFSSGAVERALGPALVAVLRNSRAGNRKWDKEDSAAIMKKERTRDGLILELPDIFENRAARQPDGRKPEPGFCRNEVNKKLDRWKDLAETHSKKLKYCEYFEVKSPVVLGTPQHKLAQLDTVYPNAPQSLRDIEETITVE